MKKVRILLGLLLIMALMSFTGCGTNNNDTIDPDTPGTVTNNRNNDNNGILDGNDDNILDDGNGILDNDNNANSPLEAQNTTNGSIGNKDQTDIRQ